MKKFSFIILFLVFYNVCFAQLSETKTGEIGSSKPIIPETQPTAKVPELVVQSSVEGFQAGVKLYQQQNYSQSEQAFYKALSFSPDNAYTLYNLGVSALKNQRIGLALAAWRRATELSPRFDLPKQGLAYLQKNHAAAMPAKAENFFEKFRVYVLNFIPLMVFYWALLITLLVTAISTIKYFASRKKAFENNLELPSTPITAIMFFLGFVTLSSLTGLKFWLDQSVRAIIILPSQAIHTGPSEDNTTLFELSEGYEVIIKRQQTNWAFISYPGGFSGWIPKQSYFIYKGRASL